MDPGGQVEHANKETKHPIASRPHNLKGGNHLNRREVGASGLGAHGETPA